MKRVILNILIIVVAGLNNVAEIGIDPSYLAVTAGVANALIAILRRKN